MFLGDSLIHRVTNNSAKEIKIDKEGSYILWAKTESKSEVPIDIRFGNEYYLRCSVKMGAFVGRPDLVVVDKRIGRIELDVIQNKNKNKNKNKK